MKLHEFFAGHPERLCRTAIAADAEGKTLLYHTDPKAVSWCLIGAWGKFYRDAFEYTTLQAAFGGEHVRLSEVSRNWSFDDIVAALKTANL